MSVSTNPLARRLVKVLIIDDFSTRKRSKIAPFRDRIQIAEGSIYNQELSALGNEAINEVPACRGRQTPGTPDALTLLRYSES